MSFFSYKKDLIRAGWKTDYHGVRMAEWNRQAEKEQKAAEKARRDKKNK